MSHAPSTRCSTWVSGNKHTESRHHKNSEGQQILDVFFFTMNYHISGLFFGSNCFQHHPTSSFETPKSYGFRMFLVYSHLNHLPDVTDGPTQRRGRETQRFEKDAIWTRPTLHCVYIDPHEELFTKCETKRVLGVLTIWYVMVGHK